MNNISDNDKITSFKLDMNDMGNMNDEFQQYYNKFKESVKVQD